MDVKSTGNNLRYLMEALVKLVEITRNTLRKWLRRIWGHGEFRTSISTNKPNNVDSGSQEAQS